MEKSRLQQLLKTLEKRDPKTPGLTDRIARVKADIDAAESSKKKKGATE